MQDKTDAGNGRKKVGLLPDTITEIKNMKILRLRGTLCRFAQDDTPGTIPSTPNSVSITTQPCTHCPQPLAADTEQYPMA